MGLTAELLPLRAIAAIISKRQTGLPGGEKAIL
jgi:hypothetical protein